ncbi:MAG: hypothetical protein AAFO07_27160, partial [Bacteroidota bacterium]
RPIVHDERLRLAIESITKDPNFPDRPFNLQSSYNLLAMCDYQQERYDSAIHHAQLAVKFYPRNPFPYSTLAEIYAITENRDSFYINLELAVERGFALATYANQPPYDKYSKEERFQNLILKN